MSAPVLNFWHCIPLTDGVDITNDIHKFIEIPRMEFLTQSWSFPQILNTWLRSGIESTSLS